LLLIIVPGQKSKKDAKRLVQKRFQQPSLVQKCTGRIVMRDIRLARNDKN